MSELNGIESDQCLAQIQSNGDRRRIMMYVPINSTDPKVLQVALYEVIKAASKAAHAVECMTEDEIEKHEVLK